MKYYKMSGVTFALLRPGVRVPYAPLYGSYPNAGCGPLFFCDIAVNHGHVVPDFDFHGKRVREPGDDALFPEFSDFVSSYYVSSGIHLNLSQYRFT